ncbi:response regulator [Geomesophilobacter sediminis]|uniref:Response regulator n=1 Tax=Geomesophilobacter sediminis TaxID=2798584 RepID=A0A8J7IL46_9BACT|nr:response regulator [Geomesophilobacter sediminis]MBJ6723393.1 response regulator [Geomesophilobacter sediminis]
MKPRYLVLVEDNPDDAYLALRVIEKVFPEKVIRARDGEEALVLLTRLAAEGIELVELVLLDLKLPKVDGIEVLRSIRSSMELKGLKVAVLTSSEDEGDQERCRELGIADYLFKPLTVAALIKVLGTAPGSDRR